MEVLLQRLADDDQTGDHEEGGDVVGGQARFGPEDAVVLARVAVFPVT